MTNGHPVDDQLQVYKTRYWFWGSLVIYGEKVVLVSATVWYGDIDCR